MELLVRLADLLGPHFWIGLSPKHITAEEADSWVIYSTITGGSWCGKVDKRARRKQAGA